VAGSFAIVTDGTCTLPAGYCDKNEVEVLPVHVTFGPREYAQGADLTTAQFYSLLVTSRDLPGTSAPSPGECGDVLARASRRSGQVLIVTVAKELSATHDAAALAARELGAKAVVIDSRSVAGGTALVVEACVRARDAGRSLEETAELARGLPRDIRFYGYFDTLEFLRRSGRATALQAYFASALQIKPIVSIGDGRIEPLARARTRLRAIERLKELVIAAVGGGRRGVRMSVLHANDESAAASLSRWAQETFDCAMLFTADVGPAVAARSGPGFLGLSFVAS